MPPIQFPTLYLNAMTSTDSTVTIKTGCNLRVEETPGVFSNVITKTVMDSTATTLRSEAASQLAESKAYADAKITALIDGADSTLDTLKELAIQMRDDEDKASSLLTQVGALRTDLTSEVAARTDALTAEADARAAAVAAETAARESAILTEVSSRNDAIAVERNARITAVSTEANARTAADEAETAARVASDAEIHKTIYNLRHVPLTAAVYADAKAPSPVPSAQLATLTQSGWYFKNSTAGDKINWYSAAPTDANGGSCKAADLSEISMSLKLVSKTDLPWITIYTKPLGKFNASSPDLYKTDATYDAKSWYHSRISFQASVADKAALVAGNSYIFQVPVGNAYTVNPTPAPCVYHKNGFTNVVMQLTESIGNFTPTSEILFITISTNSASVVNTVEFILHDLALMSSNDNVVLSFSNADVLNYYLQTKLEALYQQLGQQTIIL
jgi:hypothetical protein